MGEDRRSGDRRSGSGDRRLDSFSDQNHINSNHNTKYIKQNTFFVVLTLIFIITISSILFVYIKLYNKINQLDSYINSSDDLYYDYEYDDSLYTDDESYINSVEEESSDDTANS